MAKAAKKDVAKAPKKTPPTLGAQLRKLALALPDTAEAPHFDAASFRVRGKIFATWGEGRDPRTCVLKMAPDVQQAMIAAHGAAFTPASGAWGRSGWTHIAPARLPKGLFEDLVVSAWALVAPKKLVAEHAARLRK